MSFFVAATIFFKISKRNSGNYLETKKKLYIDGYLYKGGFSNVSGLEVANFN